MLHLENADLDPLTSSFSAGTAVVNAARTLRSPGSEEAGAIEILSSIGILF
jgi:hypothetical protein